ncbi:MAG: hypothetical protein AMXMBFR84_11840 [Candidatus Hydrogenedentota bacterium]
MILGAGAYAAVVACLYFTLMPVRWCLSSNSRTSTAAVPLSLSLSAATCWLTVTILANGAMRLSDLCASAMIAASPVLVLWVVRLTGTTRLAAIGSAIVILVAGIVAQTVVAHVYVHRLDVRPLYVTAGPAIWMVLGALMFFLLLTWQNRLAVSIPRRMTATGKVVWTVAAIVYVSVPVAATRFAAFAVKAPQADAPPNLVIVTCDALRADWMSAYGGPVPTPNADTLSSRGVLFDRAYSLAPWTIPSMHGMFSSTYPFGLTPGASFDQWKEEVGRYAFPDAPTLAEVIRSNGYATAAFTGNPLLGDPEGIMRGFQITASYPAHAPVRVSRWSQLPYMESLLFRFWPGAVDLRPVDSTAVLTTLARTFIQQNASRPFLLWVHMLDPHDPYDPPQALRGPERGPWPLFSPLAPYYGTPQLDDHGNIELSHAEQNYVRALYAADIRYADAGLGRILDALSEWGLDSNTYVVLSADHGEEMWDHGRFNHGQSLFDELVRVPLIVSGPGLEKGRVQTPVSAIDVMPTLADLLGIAAPPEWQGMSLESSLLNPIEGAEGRPVMALGTNRYAWPNVYHMIVDSRWKLIHELTGDTISLYDLASDPGEQADLSGRQPETAARLLESLEEWRLQFPLEFTAADGATGETSETSDLLERIRSMGYVR